MIEFIKWLFSLPASQFAARIFICVGALLVLVASVLLLCHLTGVASISKNGIEWHGFKRKKKSPHEGCENWNDVVILLTKQAEMLDTIHTKEKRMTKSILSYTKSIASKMRGDAQRVFLTLLKNKLTLSDAEKAGLVMHDDYREYVRALKDAYDDVFEAFEPEIFEKDFAEEYPTDRGADFQLYVQNCAQTILQQITDYLNESYHGNVVSREELYDENKKFLFDKAKQDISACYINARELKLRFAKEERDLRSAFNKQLCARQR